MILVDPIIQESLLPHEQFAKLSTSRRDTWPSREAATAKFKNNPYYQTWDPRILDKWLEFGLRDVPASNKESTSNDTPVTLTTTVAQEVYFYLRPEYYDERLHRADDTPAREISSDENKLPLGRPEMLYLYRRLPDISPSTLYVFGKDSPASIPEHRKAKMELTATGIDGNGGAPAGRVHEVLLDCGHLVAFEKPKECAIACSEFIDKEVGRWEKAEQRRDEVAKKFTREQRVDINEAWRRNLGVEKRGKL
jgi:pimeloyl-ACP methyl ester carboxylesterase